MRFLHTSDWHLGKKYQNRDRSEEQKLVLEEILNIANQQNVDAILIAGDIYDQSNPPHEADKIFYQMLPHFSLKGERPVFIIAGNHDSAAKIEVPKYLTEELSVYFVGFHDTILETYKNISGIEVTKSEAGFAEFLLPNYDYPLRMIFAPYTNIVKVLKGLPYDSDAASFLMRDYLKQRWSELANLYCDNKGVNLLMAHYTVKLPDDFSPEDYDAENPIGGNYTLYPDTFPEKIQYVALGHIHSYQVVNLKPCPIIYSSSPLCYSRKETDLQKYVVIIDLEPNQPAVFNKIPIQTGKKIFFFENIPINEIENIIEKNPNHFYEFSVSIEGVPNYLSLKNELESKYPEITKIHIMKPEMLSYMGYHEWKTFSEEQLFLNYLEKVKNIEITKEHHEVLKEILEYQPKEEQL
jgi:exonuclease SbcD